MKHTPEIKTLMTKLGGQLLTLRSTILTDGADPRSAVALVRASCLDIESAIPTETEAEPEPEPTEPKPKPKPKKKTRKKKPE